MSDLLISGYGDDLNINGIRLGDLSPSEHEKIELSKGGQNYSPLENVVVSHVKDSSTLICRKPSIDDINGWKQLSIGDRDMKLLEKVEELTLYIIDLHKRIEKLEKI